MKIPCLESELVFDLSQVLKKAPTAASCSLILLHKRSFLRVLVWKSSKHHRRSLPHMEDEESFVPSSPKIFYKSFKKKSRSCMQTERTRLLINKSRAPNRIRFVVEMPREFFHSVKVRPDTIQYLCKVFEVQENVPPTKLELGQ